MIEKVFLSDKPIVAWSIIIVILVIGVIVSTKVIGFGIDYVEENKVVEEPKPEPLTCEDKCYDNVNQFTKLDIDGCKEYCSLIG